MIKRVSISHLKIDHDSIWCDVDNNIIGAKVKNITNGQIKDYAYFIQEVKHEFGTDIFCSKGINIFESVDGSQWQKFMSYIESSLIYDYNPISINTEDIKALTSREIFEAIYNALEEKINKIDEEEKIHNLMEAVKQGNGDAMKQLGDYYLGKDRRTAIKWYESAAKYGNKKAQKLIKNRGNI